MASSYYPLNRTRVAEGRPARYHTGKLSFSPSEVEKPKTRLRFSSLRNLARNIFESTPAVIGMVAGYAGAIAKEVVVGENGNNLGTSGKLLAYGGALAIATAVTLAPGLAALPVLGWVATNVGSVTLLAIVGFSGEALAAIGNAVLPAIKRHNEQRNGESLDNLIAKADVALKAVGKAVKRQSGRAIKRHFESRAEIMQITETEMQGLDKRQQRKILRTQNSIKKVRKAHGRNTNIDDVLAVKNRRLKSGGTLTQFRP